MWEIRTVNPNYEYTSDNLPMQPSNLLLCDFRLFDESLPETEESLLFQENP